MKLVWNSTGDELEFIPDNQSLCEYFIGQLNHCALTCVHDDVRDSEPNRLISILTDINDFFVKHKVAEPFAIGDPLDQKYLNELHRSWVKFHSLNPNIILLLRMKDEQLVAKFRNINKCLHQIEKMFSQIWLGTKNGEVVTFDNPYPHLLTFSTANIQILYNDLGRTTHNKWINFDNNLDQIDTNDYANLSAEIQLNLNRPEQQIPPANYVEWCQQRGLSGAPGRWINLGNLVNLEQSLADYRQVVMRNTNNEMFIV